MGHRQLHAYRNIFDNLVTRDVSGKIVPQIATAWRNIDDTLWSSICAPM